MGVGKGVVGTTVVMVERGKRLRRNVSFLGGVLSWLG